MSHSEQLNFVETVVGEIKCADFFNINVLEIGSYDRNGSIRKHFNVKNYLGVDLINGPGVDLVYDGKKLELNNKLFDITISSECFEHDPNWDNTFKNMMRYTKSGGLLIFTCASKGRPEHGTLRTNPKDSPGTSAIGSDYYKNLSESNFLEKFKFEFLFEDYFFITQKTSKDLYFVGKVKNDNFLSDIELNFSSLYKKIIFNQKLLKKSKRKKISYLLFMIIKNIDLPLRNLLLLQNSEYYYQNYILFRRNIIKILLKITNIKFLLIK